MRLAKGWHAVAALLLLTSSCRGRRESIDAGGRYPDAPVIVISIDTLRADHLPAYGYRGVATPNIDAFRADSILFTNAYSHCPLTLPSHTSLLTAKLPWENGVRDNIGYTLGKTSDSLPQLLKARGYETGAAVSAYVLRGETGLRQLFDWYEDTIAFMPGTAAGSIQRPGSATIDAALRWIRPRSRKPFFFLLHLFEPHTPHEPPEPFRSAAANAYDGEIAYVDSLVGRFLDELKRDGIYDRAVIILLSDHGEGLGEHGEREHGIFVYRATLQVPLMLKLPKQQSARTAIDRAVGLVDVGPTVVELTGASAPNASRGVSLLSTPTSTAAPRRIYSESFYGRLHLGWSELRSLVDERYHFIDAPRPELYDLTADRNESRNILQANRRVYARFREEMVRYPHDLPAPQQINSEEAKKLAALGYLTASTPAAGTELPDPKDRIEELSLYDQATALVREHQYDRAIAAFRTLVQKNPRFGDAHIQLASLYEAEGRYGEAEAAYREVLWQNPAMTELVAIALGAVYLNLGRYDEAAAHAELAQRTNPGGAHLLLGRVALARGDYRGAENHAGDAGRDVHYRSAAALLTAEALVRQRNFERALQILDAERNAVAAERSPAVRSLELRRADALMRLGRAPEAEAAFREEIRLFPDNRDAYASLAAVYALQGRSAESQATLQALVAANPTRSSYALAAKTLEALGDRKAAVEWRHRGEAKLQ